jgi:hypothetical protein
MEMETIGEFKKESVFENVDKFQLDRTILEKEAIEDQIERIKIDIHFMLRENNRTIKMLEIDLIQINSYIEELNQTT